MKLYYERVTIGNSTLNIARFRVDNRVENKPPKFNYSKWSGLKNPRAAAKRFFTKHDDQDSLDILSSLEKIINTTVKINSFQEPKGSGISKIKNRFRVQGRVGKEVNMYLGMYDTLEEAQRVIEKARQEIRNGKSVCEIKRNWVNRNLEDKKTKQNKTKPSFEWTCPICSKVLKSKNGQKGHMDRHNNNNKPTVVRKRKIIFIKSKKTI